MSIDNVGMTKPLFHSPEQAITVTFHMTQRLSMLVTWGFVWLANLTLLLALFVLLWLLGVTPAGIVQAIRAWSESTAGVVVGFVGVSVLGLLGAYVSLCRFVARKLGAGPLFDYLTKDVRGV